jgi:hypothetical protein
MKMHLKQSLSAFALCTALAAPLPALAQSRDTQTSYGSNPHYTYGDLRLVSLDPDGPGGSADGIRLGGSVLFQPNLFGQASLTSVDNLDQLDLGVGMRHPLSSGTDLVGILGIIWADTGPDDDTGISLTGGVRSLIGPQFELGGYVGYAEIFGDGDISLTGEGLLHVTRELSLVASLGFSDDYDAVTLGARWNFR